MNNEEINLGGFPPIYFTNNEVKKKREFETKVTDDFKKINLVNLNILDIKNILNNIPDKKIKK